MRVERATTVGSDFLSDGRLPRLALICLGVWMGAADSLVTATIMPSVAADLGGYEYFSWATAGFLIGTILASASAGRLSERFGLRSAMAAAGLVLALGSAASALASNVGVFLAGRLVQGLGSGWIAGFAMVAIALLFPERHIARVFAAAAAIWGVATVLGPLVGGIFANAGEWRGVFWLFAIQAALFAAASPALLGTVAPAGDARVPWRSLGMLGLGVGAVALAGVSGSAGAALLCAAVGLGALVLVLRLDALGGAQLLPRGASDLRTICGAGYAAMFATTAASMGLAVYGPAILQQLRGLSPLWAGYVVAVEALAWTLAAFVVAGSSRAAEPRWIRLGAACILLGTALLALFMPHAALGRVIVAAATVGAGFGLSSSLMNRRVLAAVGETDRATASSALIAIRQTGGATGAALTGVAANLAGFDRGLTDATAQATALWVFLAAMPAAVAGTWAAWRMTADPHGA